MDVTKQLEEDLKQATLARDQIKLDVVRMLKSALKNYQIEIGSDLSPKQILDVLQKEAKKRHDAIESYEQNNRPDRVAQEKAELDIINGYLPAQMSDQELAEVVDQTIRDLKVSGAGDIGKTIGAVIAKVGNRASGARISELVKSKLAEKK